MKKAVSVLEWGFLALLVLPPLGTVLSSCFGYTFELVSVTAFAAVTALLSAGFVVLRLVEKSACEGGAPGVLLALSAPLSLINALLVALAYRMGTDAARTFEELEDIWNEYGVFGKMDDE